MRRALVLAVAVLASGCAGSTTPFLLDGDAKSAVVKYSGDIGATYAIAERHCARYERVAKLTGRDLDTAYFACVRP